VPGFTNIAQTVPSLALFGFLLPLIGTGAHTRVDKLTTRGIFISSVHLQVKGNVFQCIESLPFHLVQPPLDATPGLLF